MLDTAKVLEFFNAENIKHPIHVLGCGAVGSHVCEQLARIGCNEAHIWDFDTVEPKNVTNQLFTQEHVGMEKTTAVEQIMHSINPDMVIHIHGKVTVPCKQIQGYVFLCVDNIELRKAIVEDLMYSPMVISFADFRMRLIDAQYYHARTSEEAEMTAFLNTMQFTHEEAAAATPVSACGVQLSVCYTPKTVACIGIANFVKEVIGEPVHDMVLINFDTMYMAALPKGGH